MKLLRIESISYVVLYVEEGDGCIAYKKTADKWEKYTTSWKEVKQQDIIKRLEVLLLDNSEIKS